MTTTKGKVVPCFECGKDYFVTLDHGFWGSARCPHCGAETTVMAPSSADTKELLRHMGTSEEEMKKLQRVQDELNAKRAGRSKPTKSWWKFW
jgi:hypothetical protein